MQAEQSFEWMFVVPDITGPDDPRIDALYERSDALVESHGGLNIVTVLVPGRTGIDAARVAVGILGDCGLTAVRSYPDLVTRGDITERTGMERQTVDHWIRGQRRKGFPDPVHLAGRGLWLWRDIDEWLKREGVGPGAEDDVAYPLLADHAAIDNHLRRKVVVSGVMSVCTARVSLTQLATLPERHLVGAGR